MKRSPKLILGDREIDGPRTAPWHRSNGMFLAGQSEVDEADTVANRMEAKWGVGRLRLLVGAELRERFDRQRYLLNQAIWHGDLEAVRTQARRMRAAWHALDKAATEAGADPIHADVWEVTLDDGSIAAIVKGNAEAGHVVAQERGLAVYTLAEIAKLLSTFPEIVRAKEVFPGASVTAARHVTDPLEAIADTRSPLNDDIPF